MDKKMKVSSFEVDPANWKFEFEDTWIRIETAFGNFEISVNKNGLFIDSWGAMSIIPVSSTMIFINQEQK